MGVHATFDSLTRTIQLVTAPVLVDGDWVVNLDVKVDLYSDGKEDWIADEALRKLRFPITAVGGQAKPGGKLGSTFFIAPDWKICPYEASHRLRVNGNFYSVDGTSPFKSTVGAYTLILEQEISSLAEAEVLNLATMEARICDLFTSWGLDPDNPLREAPGIRDWGIGSQSFQENVPAAGEVTITRNP